MSTITPTSSTTTTDYIVDVPFVNALEKSNIYNCIRDAIIQKLQKIPELQKLKMNPELTLLVCNIIENSINNNSKNHKIDKKQLSIEILTTTFGLTILEIQQIKDQIDFLYNNGKIVKIKKFVNFLKKSIEKLGIKL